MTIKDPKIVTDAPPGNGKGWPEGPAASAAEKDPEKKDPTKAEGKNGKTAVPPKKQDDLPGMPKKSALVKKAEKLAHALDQIKAVTEEAETLRDELRQAMKKAKRLRLEARAPDSGQKYLFYPFVGEEKLKHERIA